LGFDKFILFKIYADGASADDYECPTVVVDKNIVLVDKVVLAVGRYTVVKNDKSMTSLVNNGQSWMEPMWL
jgi:DNA sulfur modification protein DndC